MVSSHRPYEQTDAVIGGKEIVKTSTNSSTTVPESLLSKVRALPEVEAASGTVSPAEVNGADIIGADGKAVGKESVGTSIDPANARFSPLKLKTGDWPAAADQVAVDAGTAKKQHYELGDAVQIVTASGKASYRITGTVSYGDVDSLGFGTIAAFDLDTAQTCSIARASSTRSRSPPRTARHPPSWCAPCGRCCPTRWT